LRPDGWWEGDLGPIYRPIYFRGGIAFHGSAVIPAYPASHGCVRVSTDAMDMLWDTGLLEKWDDVWVY
jgi:lipoprotein-anchoring transpeptidase ErfK/SrfK